MFDLITKALLALFAILGGANDCGSMHAAKTEAVRKLEGVPYALTELHTRMSVVDEFAIQKAQAALRKACDMHEEMTTWKDAGHTTAWKDDGHSTCPAVYGMHRICELQEQLDEYQGLLKTIKEAGARLGSYAALIPMLAQR